jgi:GMP synthase (glutamine-hydrolysing)
MENTGMQKLVVLDAGGQYCHLIARRLRHLGVYADVKPCSTSIEELDAYRGIIISGGPNSVYDESSPSVDKRIFSLRKPILGICYGHQLMAHILGGEVCRGKVAEYGISQLSVVTQDSLFKNLPAPGSVWMSHRDLVTSIPQGFELLAKTDSCPVAAMGDHVRRFYGVQFHPEVVHTKAGNEMLKAFSLGVCGCIPSTWKPAEQIDALKAQIKSEVGNRKVFFFVSGGVDSTVAFVLCLRALGPERIEGVFVDTGLMRDIDREDILFLQESEHANIHIEDAKDEFISLLRETYSPEKKRKIIGQHFVALHNKILSQRLGQQKDWVLGQGTIYPDTIESGSTQHSSTIKTHHNRVDTIVKLLQEGRVVEPLAQFYKDEVRQIGEELGISNRILNKQPFPGPGLGIRCICAATASRPKRNFVLSRFARSDGFKGFKLNLKTVGVKGDSRSYQSIAILTGNGDFDKLETVSTNITNEVVDVTRVLYLIGDEPFDTDTWHVVRRFVTKSRINKLRAADSHVRNYMLKHYPREMTNIWQFPVILLPLMNRRTGWESIVLRPVDSVDGMTASFTKLSKELLVELADSLTRQIGLHVLFDVTNKPPATIEWE